MPLAQYPQKVRSPANSQLGGVFRSNVIPKNTSGGGPTPPPTSFYYLRPGGVDYYRRPGGTDRYLRP